jgi:hypothetical protein
VLVAAVAVIGIDVAADITDVGVPAKTTLGSGDGSNAVAPVADPFSTLGVVTRVCAEEQPESAPLNSMNAPLSATTRLRNTGASFSRTQRYLGDYR